MAGPPTTSTRKGSGWYVPAFDGLRGVLATTVMWVHAGFPGNVLWLALPVFFVMSGYFITKILLTHPPEGKIAGIRAFLRNRVLRIGPLYIAFVLLMTALAVVGHPRSVRDDLVWLWTATYDFRIAQVGWNADIYKHTYTVGIEVQLYLLMALAALVLSRRGLRNFLIVLAVSGPLIRLMTVLVMLRSGQGYAEVIERMQALPFPYVDGFAMGGLLAYPEIFKRLPSTKSLWIGFLALIAVISGIELVAAWRTGAPFPLWDAWAISFPIDYGWLWGYSVHGLCCALVILTIARKPPLVNSVLGSRVLVWLGQRSYSIYLLHVLIFLPGRNLAGPNPSPLQSLAIFVVCGGISVAVAAVSYRYIELPFHRLKTPRVEPSAVAPA